MIFIEYDSMRHFKDSLLCLLLCMFLFISSCTNPVVRPTFKSRDIPIDVVTGSLPEMFNRYMAASPIAILIMDRETLKKDYFSRHEDIIPKNYEKVAGMCVYDVTDPEYPDNFIFLHDDLSIGKSILTLFHEFGHYKCFVTNCHCLLESVVMMELHGYRSQVGMSLETNNVDLIEICMVDIAETIDVELDSVDVEDPHFIAAKALTHEFDWNFLLLYLYQHRYGDTMEEIEESDKMFGHSILKKNSMTQGHK